MIIVGDESSYIHLAINSPVIFKALLIPAITGFIYMVCNLIIDLIMGKSYKEMRYTLIVFVCGLVLTVLGLIVGTFLGW